MPPPPSQPPPPGPPGGAGYGFPPPAGGWPPPQGGWPPPPAPPGGGRNHTAVIAVAASAFVVVVALTVGGVVLLGKDGTKHHDALPSAPSTTSAAPEPVPTWTPTSSPADTPTDGLGLPSFEDSMPTPSHGPRFAFQLHVGDCFDTTQASDGKGEPVACSSPHDAEVVLRKSLPDGLTTDQGIRDKADALCKSRLRDKAHAQPRGTEYRTLIQFPALKGFDLGMRTVTCSLTAEDGKKLHGTLD